jgi:AraC family transcriptional regulator of adaptative response/methylated-DNA-[protein]-cysteine methyltransferase
MPARGGQSFAPQENTTFPEVFAIAFGDDQDRDDVAPAATVTWIATPLGPMVAAAVDEGICLLEYTDPMRLQMQAAQLRSRIASRIVDGDHPHLSALRDQLAGYFAGTLKQFTLPLVARGTPFEERVWQALRRIPHGQTRSYLEIARELGSPEGQRAVGRANGLNRIAIVIPCHRVVNHGGGLGGYGGGLWRKERLLDLERGPGQRSLFTP